MSWSFGAVGRPAAVAAKVDAAKGQNKCINPEEGLRQAALDLIANSVRAFPDASVVTVEANGHQSTADGERAQNTLSIKVMPLYGFVE